MQCRISIAVVLYNVSCLFRYTFHTIYWQPPFTQFKMRVSLGTLVHYKCIISIAYDSDIVCRDIWWSVRLISNICYGSNIILYHYLCINYDSFAVRLCLEPILCQWKRHLGFTFLLYNEWNIKRNRIFAANGDLNISIHFIDPKQAGKTYNIAVFIQIQNLTVCLEWRYDVCRLFTSEQKILSLCRCRSIVFFFFLKNVRQFLMFLFVFPTYNISNNLTQWAWTEIKQM